MLLLALLEVGVKKSAVLLLVLWGVLSAVLLLGMSSASRAGRSESGEHSTMDSIFKAVSSSVPAEHAVAGRQQHTQQ
jgi:hypothetical protein